jgi:hypothetical protein
MIVKSAAPHATTRDDEYNGYFIPKGTIVIGNAWSVFTRISCMTIVLNFFDRAIMHNPEDYPNPETFNPSRYLTLEGKLDPSIRDPRTACFGFGRRMCPGRHLADASLFAMVSTLLATVNIVRAKDADGKEIIPEVDVTSGILSHPKPFAWAAQSRSRHTEELLAHALATH